MPGHTLIGLSPNKEKQKVVKILSGGRDILASGIDTKRGDKIEDVTIVVGPVPCVAQTAANSSASIFPAVRNCRLVVERKSVERNMEIWPTHASGLNAVGILGRNYNV